MLEEQLGVTPEAAQLVRPADNPAHRDLFAAKLGRLIEADDLEHDGVHWDGFDLVLEIVLVHIRPPINVVGLKLNLERPVGLLFLVAVLIVVSHVHD